MPERRAWAVDQLLRKTLELEYLLPGSAAGRSSAEPTRMKSRWIMR